MNGSTLFTVLCLSSSEPCLIGRRTLEGEALCLNMRGTLLLPYILKGGNFTGDFCFTEGEWMRAFFFFLLGTAGGFLLAGVYFEVTWQRGFLPMFTHYTFKYDTLMPIHRTTSVLSNSPARNRRFIPREKVAFSANAGRFMLTRRVLELLLFKY